jgi:hypothetical protein
MSFTLPVVNRSTGRRLGQSMLVMVSKIAVGKQISTVLLLRRIISAAAKFFGDTSLSLTKLVLGQAW